MSWAEKLKKTITLVFLFDILIVFQIANQKARGHWKTLKGTGWGVGKIIRILRVSPFNEELSNEAVSPDISLILCMFYLQSVEVETPENTN